MNCWRIRRFTAFGRRQGLRRVGGFAAKGGSTLWPNGPWPRPVGNERKYETRDQKQKNDHKSQENEKVKKLRNIPPHRNFATKIVSKCF